MKSAAQSTLPGLTRTLELILASHGPVSPGELEFARGQLCDLQSHPPGADIGKGSGSARMVLSGWAGWSVQLADGRRQIISVALPGDLLEAAPVEGLSMVNTALTAVQTADVTALVELVEREDMAASGLAAAWRAARSAARARAVHQTLRLGRLSAYERAASLLLELYERQRRVGLADDRSMPLPLTQEMLADILGLSVVHVNRVLQQLRREDLIVYRAGRVVFPDLEGLAAAAGRE